MVGHVAVALREPNGTLYVVETTDTSHSRGQLDTPPPWGVRRLTWKRFIEIYNERSYNIVWWRLRRDLRDSFDGQKAWQYFLTSAVSFVFAAPLLFHSQEGRPFGWWTLVPGVLDTISVRASFFCSERF